MAWGKAVQKTLVRNVLPSAGVGAGIGAIHGIIDSEQTMLGGATRGAVQGAMVGGTVGMVQAAWDARIGHHRQGNARHAAQPTSPDPINTLNQHKARKGPSGSPQTNARRNAEESREQHKVELVDEVPKDTRHAGSGSSADTVSENHRRLLTEGYEKSKTGKTSDYGSELTPLEKAELATTGTLEQWIKMPQETKDNILNYTKKQLAEASTLTPQEIEALKAPNILVEHEKLFKQGKLDFSERREVRDRMMKVVEDLKKSDPALSDVKITHDEPGLGGSGIVGAGGDPINREVWVPENALSGIKTLRKQSPETVEKLKKILGRDPTNLDLAEHAARHEMGHLKDFAGLDMSGIQTKMDASYVDMLRQMGRELKPGESPQGAVMNLNREITQSGDTVAHAKFQQVYRQAPIEKFADDYAFDGMRSPKTTEL